MASTSRPLGGISALTLGVVSAEGTAPSLFYQGVEFRLLEDRSTYTQSERWSAGERSVKHTLMVITPLEYTLPEALEAGLTQGFAALIALNSLDEIEVGCDAGEPLWLSSCTTVSGEKAASRGYREWTFETLTEEEIEQQQEGSDSDDEASANGISSLSLCAASASSTSAPDFDVDGIEVPLFEDLSTYSEKATFVGAEQSVTHSLLIYTAVDYTLPTALADGLSRGFAALAQLNAGSFVSAGWSQRAAFDRALRLVSCSVGCSTKSDGVYYKEWLFESTDGVSNI